MDILNTASTLAGGIISAHAQDKANQLNYKMFQEGNAFNAKQAALNRDATSAYTVAMQQRKAGLNPASQGATPLSSGGSAASTSGMPSMQPVDGFASALNQIALQNSQIELNNSLRDKNDSETDLNDIEKQFRADILRGQIELNNCTIDGIEYDNAKLKPAQLRELQAHANELDASSASLAENMRVAQQQIANMKEEEIATRLDNYFNSHTLQARIRGVKLDNDYKQALKAQVYNLIRVGNSEIALNDANRRVVNLTYANGKISYAIRKQTANEEYKATKEALKYSALDSEHSRKTYHLQWSLERTQQVVDIFSDAIGSLTQVGNVINGAHSASGIEKMGDAAESNSQVNASRMDLEWQKYGDYISNQGRRKKRGR